MDASGGPVQGLNGNAKERATAGRADERGLPALVESVARGDESALCALYDLTCRWVFLAAHRILQDRHRAEEVTLDVFLQVWKGAARFDRRRGSVPVWLMTMVRSRALDRLRAARSRARSEAEAARDRVFEATPDRGPELRSWLFEALDQLPEPQRRVVELAYFPGLTHVEIAARIGEPLGTVKTRIRLGMSKLRELLVPLEEGR